MLRLRRDCWKLAARIERRASFYNLTSWQRTS